MEKLVRIYLFQRILWDGNFVAVDIYISKYNDVYNLLCEYYKEDFIGGKLIMDNNYDFTIKKKQKTYILIYVICLFSLIKLNFMHPGQAVTDIFFSNRNDSGMDFFNPVVFASNNLADMFKNMDGITYPSFAVCFFRFLYICIPSEIIESCNGDVLLLRGNQFLFVEYIFSVVTAVVITTVMIEVIIKKNLGENYYTIFPFIITLSYGMIYAIERGNIVFFVPMLILIYIYYKDDNRWYVREVALISIAIAAGLKIYPAFWGILLLVDKRIYDAIRTLVYGVICLVGPMIYYGGFNAVEKWINNLTGFNSIQGNVSDLAGCGAVQLARTICYLLGINEKNANIIYTFVGNTQMLICIVLLLGVFILKKNWEKYCAIVLMMIFFPRWSNDYCYIYFMIPFIFVLCDREWTKSNSFFYYMLGSLLIIYLLPKFIVFEKQNYAFEVSDMMRQIVVIIILFKLLYMIVRRCIYILKRKNPQKYRN